MNAGTKVFLAVVALLVGVMILYYGLLQTGDHPSPARGGTLAGDPDVPVTRTAAPSDASRHDIAPALRNDPQPAAPAIARIDPESPAVIPPATDPLADLGVAATTDTGGILSDALAQTPSAAGAHRPATNQPGETSTAGSSTTDNAAGASSTEKTAAPPTIKSNTPTPRPGDVRTLNRQGTNAAGTSTPTSAPPGVKPTPTIKPSEGVEYTWYTVKSGDTGVSIAEEWFGDGNKWVLISKANPLVDFHRLQIGQKLRLPPKNATAAAPASTAGTAARTTNGNNTGGGGAAGATSGGGGDPNTYIVKSGDTLISIARAKYGDGSLWEHIYAANKKTIGDDPGMLAVGMRLTIPTKPVVR